MVPGTYDDNRGIIIVHHLPLQTLESHLKTTLLFVSVYFVCYLPQLEKIFLALYSEKKKKRMGVGFLSRLASETQNSE